MIGVRDPSPEASADQRVADLLALRDEAETPALKRIGESIGFGNAQSILGRLWDEMLHAEYGVPPVRGQMGVTVDDALPPIPKSAALRRKMRPHGGYEMVPAYSVEELKAFAHAAIAKARSYSDIDVVWIDVPVPLIPAFSEVIRGGMAFERGQPPELYAFAEKIQQIAQKQAEAQSKLLEAPSEPMFMYGILVPP